MIIDQQNGIKPISRTGRMTLLCLLMVILIPSLSFSQAAPGEKTLTLSLTDTPLNQLLSIISDTFSVGVVASKGATGNVNVALTNATLEETLDNITQPNGWVWRRKENTITILTQQEYQEILKGEVITKTFFILHANAQDVQTVIQPFISTAGKIIRDDRTNQLQVTDTPESIARIEQIIQSIDVPVEVEVFPIKYAIASDIKQQIDKVRTAKGDIQIDERTNTLIITDVPSAIDKIRDMILNLDIETQMEIFDIRFAKPKDIQSAIKELLTKKGYVQVDERNSKVIVDDIPTHLEKIARVIKALDEPDRVVYIEAEVMLIDYQKSLELGIDWNYGAAWSLTNSTSASSITIPLVGGQWYDSVKNFFSGYSTYLGLSASAVAKAVSKLDGDSEFLASPRILVKNDEEAKILVGGTVPYSVLYTQPLSGTTGNYYQQYYSQVSQEYGVKLTVKPHISADGSIDIKISIENTSADPVTLNPGTSSAFTGVSTKSAQAQTQVSVQNNETVIIGGMVSKLKTASGSGIPFLENIPLIGPVLFGSRSSSSRKQNLVLFMTPHIVRGTRAEAEKLYPEAYKTYSQVTSEETDKEKKERLKKEQEELIKQKESELIPIPPDISSGQPVLPDSSQPPVAPELMMPPPPNRPIEGKPVLPSPVPPAENIDQSQPPPVSETEK